MINILGRNRYSFINASKAVTASLFGYVIGHALGAWLEVSLALFTFA